MLIDRLPLGAHWSNSFAMLRINEKRMARFFAVAITWWSTKVGIDLLNQMVEDALVKGLAQGVPAVASTGRGQRSDVQRRLL